MCVCLYVVILILLASWCSSFISSLYDAVACLMLPLRALQSTLRIQKKKPSEVTRFIFPAICHLFLCFFFFWFSQRKEWEQWTPPALSFIVFSLAFIYWKSNQTNGKAKIKKKIKLNKKSTQKHTKRREGTHTIRRSQRERTKIIISMIKKKDRLKMTAATYFSPVFTR